MTAAPSWGARNVRANGKCVLALLGFLRSWKLSGYFIEFVEFKQRKNSLEFLTDIAYDMGQKLEDSRKRRRLASIFEFVNS